MLPPSASCVVLLTFFKQKEGWKTINAAISCQTLRRLRRAILTSGLVLIHDNARPHDAAVTQYLLDQFKWDVSDYPMHRSDLATCHFHIFPPKLPEK
ncbi:hypothetical protein AVEN_93807-1 [Araneus ventricosus]|uniref:Histone-lysine N-methyltransferase SETMAR n=1 Tax=Araneus ventricosus TaxID=182803 RepID=A0A4Y2B104_ARAVE|nr:hypothetical protein AVEN_93807-1 [Araneus ventricosus]